MEPQPATLESSAGGVTERRVYTIQCVGKSKQCKGTFQSVSKAAKTCCPACRQKKWRGQVISTDAEALEGAFGELYPNAADVLQDWYMRH